VASLPGCRRGAGLAQGLPWRGRFSSETLRLPGAQGEGDRRLARYAQESSGMRRIEQRTSQGERTMKTLSKLVLFALPLLLAAPVMAEETAAAPAATDAAKPAPAKKGAKAKKDPGSPEAPAGDAAKAEGEKKEGDAAKPAKKGKAKKAEGEKKEGEAK
jgi:hypothetical protein